MFFVIFDVLSVLHIPFWLISTFISFSFSLSHSQFEIEFSKHQTTFYTHIYNHFTFTFTNARYRSSCEWIKQITHNTYTLTTTNGCARTLSIVRCYIVFSSVSLQKLLALVRSRFSLRRFSTILNSVCQFIFYVNH